ncbi:hypothetical protein [Natronoglycomyces albus]|uniref:Uncharacterized protein n=1 Tax=Natronoglycomyces albus TaxID=2811108 RepID=A0A895XHA8_9ACTN|nr:hypothetical protein [Natronoglycomyces albus]QSB04734.1 hypothetical protein JQS30_13290 [Natronoglycomyces albus]
MTTFMDLPIHPLAVHAPLVFVPLLLIAALVYLLIAPLRRRIGWVVFILSILAPAAVFGAVWSGRELADGRHLTPDGNWPEAIVDHASYGDRLLWILLGLAPVLWLFGVLEKARRNAAATNGGADTQPLDPNGEPNGPSTSDDPANKGRRIIMIVLGIIAIALIGLGGWMVFEVGHSGSEMVWGTE